MNATTTTEPSGFLPPRWVIRSAWKIHKALYRWSGGRFGLRLNGHSAVFPHSGHSLPKTEVQQVRKFLESCGVDPARDYPL